MTVKLKVLIPAKYAESATTTQYTATSVQTMIDKFTITNTTAGAVGIDVNLVTAAGTAGPSNVILTKVIQAGETYTCPELVGHVLAVSGFISTIATAASSLNIRASGREVT